MTSYLRLHRLIFRAMRLLIALNTSKYGKGASREVLRDLQGELNTPTATKPHNQQRLVAEEKGNAFV